MITNYFLIIWLLLCICHSSLFIIALKAAVFFIYFFSQSCCLCELSLDWVKLMDPWVSQPKPCGVFGVHSLILLAPSQNLPFPANFQFIINKMCCQSSFLETAPHVQCFQTKLHLCSTIVFLLLFLSIERRTIHNFSQLCLEFINCLCVSSSASDYQCSQHCYWLTVRTME